MQRETAKFQSDRVSRIPILQLWDSATLKLLNRFQQILCDDDPLYLARAFADGAEL